MAKKVKDALYIGPKPQKFKGYDKPKTCRACGAKYYEDDPGAVNHMKGKC